jgi:hypothetical protein
MNDYNDPTCHHCGAWPKALGGWVCACESARTLDLIRAREVSNLLALAAVQSDTPERDELITAILRTLAGAAQNEIPTLRAVEIARTVEGLAYWTPERLALWLQQLRQSVLIMREAREKSSS